LQRPYFRYAPFGPAQAPFSGKIRLGNGSPASAAQAAGEKETVVIWLEEQEEAKPPDTP
jgi:hypothetical protein